MYSFFSIDLAFYVSIKCQKYAPKQFNHGNSMWATCIENIFFDCNRSQFCQVSDFQTNKMRIKLSINSWIVHFFCIFWKLADFFSVWILSIIILYEQMWRKVLHPSINLWTPIDVIELKRQCFFLLSLKYEIQQVQCVLMSKLRRIRTRTHL